MSHIPLIRVLPLAVGEPGCSERKDLRVVLRGMDFQTSVLPARNVLQIRSCFFGKSLTDKPGHLPRKMTNLNGWVVSSQDHTREKKELLRAHEEAVSNSEH